MEVIIWAIKTGKVSVALNDLEHYSPGQDGPSQVNRNRKFLDQGYLHSGMNCFFSSLVALLMKAAISKLARLEPTNRLMTLISGYSSMKSFNQLTTSADLP
jgi:hypothetical protein